MTFDVMGCTSVFFPSFDFPTKESTFERFESAIDYFYLANFCSYLRRFSRAKKSMNSHLFILAHRLFLDSSSSYPRSFIGT